MQDRLGVDRDSAGLIQPESKEFQELIDVNAPGVVDLDVRRAPARHSVAVGQLAVAAVADHPAAEPVGLANVLSQLEPRLAGGTVRAGTPRGQVADVDVVGEHPFQGLDDGGLLTDAGAARGKNLQFAGALFAFVESLPEGLNSRVPECVRVDQTPV